MEIFDGSENLSSDDSSESCNSDINKDNFSCVYVGQSEYDEEELKFYKLNKSIQEPEFIKRRYKNNGTEEKKITLNLVIFFVTVMSSLSTKATLQLGADPEILKKWCSMSDPMVRQKRKL